MSRFDARPFPLRRRLTAAALVLSSAACEPVDSPADAGPSWPPLDASTPGADGGAVYAPTDASLTVDAGLLTDSAVARADAAVAPASDSGPSADGGGSGDAGTDASADAAVLPRPDLGKGDGSDVVLLGDSWMSNTLQLEGTGGGIAPSLISLTGQRYRNHAVQGVMLLEADLFGPAIPTQWDDAVRENPNIATVVMTAGGNDIIQDSSVSDACASGGPACTKKLADILAALESLWARLSSSGVKDIVHVTYSSAAGSVKDFDKNVADLEAACAAVPAPARCHLVKSTALVAKSDLAIDGIHPLKSANDRIATTISALMTAAGMRR
jgi:hypothetical protein